MVTDVNQTYRGDCFTIYIQTSNHLCCMPEINIMLKLIYLNKRKKTAKKTHTLTHQAVLNLCFIK